MSDSVLEKNRGMIRYIAVTALMGAIAAAIQFLEFSVPIMPGFIKLDFSELPALISAFALGPVSGGCVCLIKNLFKLLTTQTGGIGELANFLIGICLVIPAGLIYRADRTRRGAIIGCLGGSLCMALLSLPVNYFITYPIYEKFMPIDAIIGAYQAINPNVNGLLGCLVMFNMPFTFCKGLIDSIITFAVYKRLSPVIKGRKEKKEPAGV